jgi:hypothetical protein
MEDKVGKIADVAGARFHIKIGKKYRGAQHNLN